MLCCLFCCTELLHAAGDPNPVDPYISAIKSLSKSCSMEYRADYVYPDKHIEHVSGRMAVAGDNYFDSSNIRFVLKNQTWLVNADHVSKMLNVLYLPDLAKQLSKSFDLDVSGFLFPELDLYKPAGYRFSNTGGDTLIASLKYISPDGPTIAIQLWYPKGSFIPARYTGTVSYPQGKNDPSQQLTIHFSCSRIGTVPDPALFDSRRLIEMSGKRNARMKRYNNYLVYRRSNA
jgi:hypothetical protein